MEFIFVLLLKMCSVPLNLKVRSIIQGILPIEPVPNMEQRNPERDEDIEAEADDIAATITKILVQAFTQKEGREPTSDEVQMLIEELTEERIESLLNGKEVAEGDEGSDEDAADEKEIENDEQEIEQTPVIATSSKRSLDEKVQETVETEGENADTNGQNKKLRASSDEEATGVL